MALNFGLGFSFRGQDAGLGRAITGLSRDFRTLGKEMLGLQRLQTMLSALSFDRLGELGDKFKTLSVGGMELTSSIESTFTAFDKETRKLGATMGYTGKELTKFKKEASGMAYSMNIGADQAGKAIYGFQAVVGDLKAADILKDMGVDSAKTLAKLAEVAGISGDKFSYSLIQMAKTSGIAGKDVSQITDMLTKFGTKTNDVTGALGKVDEITALLGKRKMLGDNPEQIAAFGKGIVASADAFYNVFQDGDKALAFATGLSTALTDNKQQFKDLAAGAASALPELSSKIAIAGTGIDDAFRSMNQGPEQFLKNFAGAVGKLSKDDAAKAMEFFRAHAMTAFGDAGEGIVKMLQTTEGRAALMSADVGKMVAESAGATGKLAKEGFTTGLTAAELFERQQQGFMQRFRGLATKSTSDFLASTQASFNIFAKAMEDVAKDNGPLGKVLGKLADVQKFGATALFPENIQGPMIALGAAAESLTGPIAKLRAVGIDLFTPWGALLSLFGGIAAMFASEFMDIWKTAAPAFKKAGLGMADTVEYVAHKAIQKVGIRIIDFMQNDLPGYVNKAVKFVAGFARKILSGGLMQGTEITGNKETDAVLQSLMKVLKQAFDAAVVFAKDMAGGLWDGIVGNVVDPQKANDGAVIGAAIGKTLRQAFDWVVDQAAQYLSDWWDRMVFIWEDESMPFSEKIGAWFKTSLPLLIAGSILAITFAGPIIAAFASLFMTIAIELLPLMLKYLWKSGLQRALVSIGSRMVAMIGNWGQLLWHGIKQVFLYIAGSISAAGAIVIAAFAAFFIGMFQMAKEEGDSFGDTWDRMWANIFTTVQWYGAHIWNFLSFIGTNTLTIFENLGAGIINAFMWAFDGLRSGYISIHNYIAGMTSKLAEAIAVPLTSVMQTIGDMLAWLASSPKLAEFFGVSPETMAGIKGAGEYLQNLQTGDVAGALKDDLIPEPEKFVPLQMRALRGLDSDNVESLGSRQRAVGAIISEDRDARIAAKTSIPDLTPGGRPKVSPEQTSEAVPPALIAALDDPSWTKEAAKASAEQIQLLTDIKVALERLAGKQPLAQPSSRPVRGATSPPPTRTSAPRRG